jgi:MFS family permease
LFFKNRAKGLSFLMSNALSAQEKTAAFSLAGIYALRMFGLFLIMPVFAIYAEQLIDVTPVLIGLAIGIYGLTQAALQIPFGALSDRIGRKPVIIGGLLLFALGSVIAASADSIWGIILGRAIQGSGAIAAAVMALAADLSRDSQRTKVMAVIGVSIGLSFALSLVLGPVLDGWIGVSGIFWMTAVLALLGIAVIALIVPTPIEPVPTAETLALSIQLGAVVRNSLLLRLDFGILILHMVMTALFLSYPLMLRDIGGLAVAQHWLVYLPVLVCSVALMIPFILLAEKRGKQKPVFLGAIALLATAQLALGVVNAGLLGLALWLLLYFVAFNLLEATLPALISKAAPPESKGTAMGVYSTSQFAGAFLGGVIGGWVFAQTDAQGVFLFGAIAVLLWLVVAAGMQMPKRAETRIMPSADSADH